MIKTKVNSPCQSEPRPRICNWWSLKLYILPAGSCDRSFFLTSTFAPRADRSWLHERLGLSLGRPISVRRSPLGGIYVCSYFNCSFTYYDTLHTLVFAPRADRSWLHERLGLSLDRPSSVRRVVFRGYFNHSFTYYDILYTLIIAPQADCPIGNWTLNSTCDHLH